MRGRSRPRSCMVRSASKAPHSPATESQMAISELVPSAAMSSFFERTQWNDGSYPPRRSSDATESARPSPRNRTRSGSVMSHPRRKLSKPRAIPLGHRYQSTLILRKSRSAGQTRLRKRLNIPGRGYPIWYRNGTSFADYLCVSERAPRIGLRLTLERHLLDELRKYRPRKLIRHLGRVLDVFVTY
jgi:hypothetical protein